MKDIRNPYLEREIIRYGNLGEFFALARESNQDDEYTLAWIDCSATGTRLGRGLFIRGNHAESITGKNPRDHRPGG